MSNDNSERTEISGLGEFGLIDHLTQGIELKIPPHAAALAMMLPLLTRENYRRLFQ